MRVPDRALRVLFLGLAALVSAAPLSGVLAQELALAERGPRFLLVKQVNQPPVEIDASSSGSMRLLVSLDLEEPTVGRVLAAIEDQTGLRFVYSRSIVAPERSVSLRASSITVAAALTEVLLDANVDVLLSSGPHVALVPRQRATTRQDTTGIVGRVTDKASGSPIAGASVTAEAQARHSTTTNDEGRFRLSPLEPGLYSVRVRYIGYAPVVATINVVSGVEATLELQLERSIQRLEDLVTVTPGGVQTALRAVPSPVTVITADDIEDRAPQTITDIFRQGVPSSVAFDAPAQPSVTVFGLRGATAIGGAVGVKTLIDGIEMSNFTVAPVDPASIERVEVIRGPQAATVYGPDAASGVVQIFTKRGDKLGTRPQISLRAEAGLLQTPYDGYESVVRTSVSAEMRGGTAEATYNVGASWWQLPDWVDENGASSNQSVPSLYGGLHYSRGVVTFDLSARYLGTKNFVNGNPLILESGLVSLSQPTFQQQNFTNQTAGGRLAIAPSKWWRTQFTVGYDRSFFDQVQTQPRLTTPADTLLTVGEQEQSKISLANNTTFMWDPSPAVSTNLTVGVDYYRLPASTFVTVGALNTDGTIVLAPGQEFSVARTTVTNTGLFGQLEVGIHDRLFLTLGVRGDDNSTIGANAETPVYPRFGLAYSRDFQDITFKVRGAYGGSMRAPAPGQTFGVSTPTQITLANPDLRPVRQKGWDAGIDVVGRNFSIGVTTYDQVADDLILFQLVGTNPVPTFQNQNVGKVTNRGVELEGTLSLWGGRLDVRGQYAYTFSRIDELGTGFLGDDRVGDQSRGIPTHAAGGTVALYPANGTRITGGVTYVGSYRQSDFLALVKCFGGTGPCQPTNRDYIVDFPGFAKLNLGISQQLSSSVTALFTVDNLTNNLAYEGSSLSPVQGRLTSVGMQLRY